MKVQRFDGHVEAGWGVVADAVRAVLDRDDELGAACCVYAEGRVVVDVWGGTADPVTGRTYTGDTLQLLHTATVGAVALCGAALVERGAIDLDAPVATYWPDFAAEGKGHIPVRWLFTHQAGVTGLAAPLSPDEIMAVAPVTEALARQRPRWTPGSAHGYHGVTFGWLLGELVRRRTGRTLGAFFADEVATPCELEFWIGLPGALEWRVAPLLAAVGDGDRDGDGWGALGAPSLDGLGGRSPVNSRAFHATEIPGINGIATARALAGMYAAAVGCGPGTPLLSRSTLDLVTGEQVDGHDLVLGRRTRFGLGFSLPTEAEPLLGPGSFGSLGVGSAVGSGDRDRGVAVGYVTNRLTAGATAPVAGSEAVLAALRACGG